VGLALLNREFFSLLHQRMADKCLLILAMDNGEPIAGALNMIGSDALSGRYWGRSVERPFLHFEVCYYQAIEFAIERSLACVEAGAQGEHKLARGTSRAPDRTRLHWIAHSGLRNAVADSSRQRARSSAKRVLRHCSPTHPSGRASCNNRKIAKKRVSDKSCWRL